MSGRCVGAIVAAVLLAGGPASAETPAKPKGTFTAEPIVVGTTEDVTPDAELSAFLVELSKATQGVDARPDLFASPIRVFVRPPDALAPPVEKKPAKYWNELASRMKAEGQPVPAASPDRDAFLERLAGDLGGDDPIGRVEGMGDAVCLPAGLSIDAGAVRAAAAAVGVKGAPSLRYSTEPLPFRIFAPGPTVVELPPGTLPIREPLVPGAEIPREPRFVTTDGRRGSVSREALRGSWWRSLRRHHTCLGKVDGRWKVTAVIFARPE